MELALSYACSRRYLAFHGMPRSAGRPAVWRKQPRRVAAVARRMGRKTRPRRSFRLGSKLLGGGKPGVLEAEDGKRSKMRCSGHRSVMLRQRLPTGELHACRRRTRRTTEPGRCGGKGQQRILIFRSIGDIQE
jgi:hypothetical protein